MGLYRLQNDRYPTSADGGLNALLTQPSSARNWRGPYLEKKALDPWKREFQYLCPGVKNPGGFDLWSKGPDEANPADDINNWDE